MRDLAQFFGRFHPLLVHFPIGLLLLAAVLDLAGRLRARRGSTSAGATWRAATGPLLAAGAVMAVLSAVAGTLLGNSGGYGGGTYTRHMWLGYAVAASAVLASVTWIPAGRSVAWNRVHGTVLALTAILLVAAGHLGGTLARGDGYLMAYAPAPLKALLGSSQAAAAPGPKNPREVVIFDELIQPVLQTHCTACHGENKADGELRLDSFEELRKGGSHGAVITPGQATASEIVRRIHLPPTHKDAMPPAGRKAPAPGDALLLRWWIDQGADPKATLADAEIAPDVQLVLEGRLGPISFGGPVLPPVDVPAAPADAIAAVERAGFGVSPVADGSPFLDVHATNARARVGDAQVELLAPIARQVLWLDLGGTAVTDAAMPAVARLPHLTRLHLQRTAITDAGLAHLKGLAHLEYLNLYGTRVTDEGLNALSGLAALRQLYVWQTSVTEEGAGRLRTSLPRLVVDLGGADSASPEESQTEGSSTASASEPSTAR
ncbi:MAG TPA: c-type cytochrome domain-containing protein [Vicinamibacterales bacterium]